MIHARRRFEDHKPAGKPWVLQPDHKAVVNAKTRYPSTVRKADGYQHVFKSGKNSRKIGSHVTKGRWAGMPIYTLTLEERATCPSYCPHWHDCFGNKMHWAHRFAKGPALERQIKSEIVDLAKMYPKGFVVRLHVLGDFYSERYIKIWERLLFAFPELHVFGYTALRRGSTLGALIAKMNEFNPDQSAIRFSEQGGEMGTTTIDKPARGMTEQGIVCPAQTGDSDCCGTCGLCWNTTKPIVFLLH